jgi:GntR family transcriptional regulator, phosphonate transport system regulatory protein
MQRHHWRMLRDTLEHDILTGKLQPGDQLPAEPTLARQFQTGRHSVRRALADLAHEGRISIEQGRGTFVEAKPLLTYLIGQRTRLRQNLNSQGVDVSSQMLATETVAPDSDVAQALGLTPGAEVVRRTQLTLADGLPVAFGSSYHDAQRFADFSERRTIFGSVSETYKSYGIADYLRAETSISSRRSTPSEAKILRQHPDMPVMVVDKLDTELDGTPLGFSQVIWSSARIKFVIDHG